MGHKIAKERSGQPVKPAAEEEKKKLEAEKELNIKKTKVSVTLLVMLLIVEIVMFRSGALSYEHFAGAAVCDVLAILYLLWRWKSKLSEK